MRLSYGWRVVTPVIGGLLLAGQLGAQTRWSSLNDFLERDVGLTRSQLTALSRGEVVGKLLGTSDENNVAAFGTVQVNVPRSFFIERQRDLPAALRTPSRRQVQLFSNPAVEADVKAVNFSSDDVKELRACRPNECNFKLPATTMDAVRAVDLSAPGAPDRASAFARRQIIDYVTDYRQRGNAAMLVYDDRGSVRSSDALVAMMKDSSYTFAMVPSLANFVVNYPRDPLGDATEAMFWSVDELPHVRPVLRIMHQVVYSPPEIPGMTILAAKQIYANHYFEAGLELLAAVDRVDAGAAAGTKGITLVAVRRYRFDHLPNGGPINVRGRVRGGLQDNVVADLTRLKRDYEAAWRAASDR